MFNEIFSTNSTTTKQVAVLSKTTIVTAHARTLAANFIENIREQEHDKELKEQVVKSMDDYTILESLIEPIINNAMVDDIKGASDDEVKKMIRSQASSKSHIKKKLVDSKSASTYQSYVAAAIGEALIRKAYDIPKNFNGISGTTRTSILYTEDELEVLAQDQHEVRKAIRNVQSKKSIEKRKNGEDTERYMEILQAEQQLFNIRTANFVVPNKTKEISDMLNDVEDINKLKKDDLLNLINEIKQKTL